MQGFLFNLPILILGINSLSIFLGVIFSASWAFIQPFLFVAFIFNQNLVNGLIKIIKDLKPIFPNIENYLIFSVIFLFILKIFLTFIYSYTLFRNEKFIFNNKRFQDLNLVKSEELKIKKTSILKSTLKEMLSPLFLFSLGISTTYLYFQDSNLVETVWKISRMLAIAFFSLYALRLIPIEKTAKLLNKLGLSRNAKTLEYILNNLNK